MKCNICPHCIILDIECSDNQATEHTCPKCLTKAIPKMNDERICWFCGFDFNKKKEIKA